MPTQKLSHSRFRVTPLNKGRIAIEMLTILLLIDVVHSIGRAARHTSFRHAWILFIFATAVFATALLVTQAVAETLVRSTVRSALVRMMWPIVLITDRLRLVPLFPLSLVTALWFRVVHRQYWRDPGYRAVFELRDPNLSALLGASARRDYSEAVDVASEVERSPRSLVEYIVARDLRDVLANAGTAMA